MGTDLPTSSASPPGRQWQNGRRMGTGETRSKYTIKQIHREWVYQASEQELVHTMETRDGAYRVTQPMPGLLFPYSMALTCIAAKSGQSTTPRPWNARLTPTGKQMQEKQVRRERGDEERKERWREARKRDGRTEGGREERKEGTHYSFQESRLCAIQNQFTHQPQSASSMIRPPPDLTLKARIRR